MTHHDHRITETLLGEPLRAIAEAYRRAVTSRFDFHQALALDGSSERRALDLTRITVVRDLDRSLREFRHALDTLRHLDAAADLLAAVETVAPPPPGRRTLRQTRPTCAAPQHDVDADIPF